MTAESIMTATRTQLLLDHPWFGSLAMRLALVPDAAVPTVDTDGSVIRYNPEFVCKQTRAHMLAIMAHNVLHCALLHPYRRGSRKSSNWNRACDNVVNLALKDAGFQLPQDAVMDPKYAGLAAEVVYAQMGQEEDDSPQGGGKSPQDTPLSTGTVSTPKPGTGTPQEGTAGQGQAPQPQGMTEEDWKIAAEQATAVTRKAGKVPGEAARLTKAARQQPEDWRAILREFIEQTQPSDYSWSAPNRRHIASGLYLPGIVKENLRSLGVAVDTSGSVSRAVLEAFAQELTAIAQEARPESVDVAYVDTAVRHTETFSPDDAEIVLAARGGGGTRFQPALDHFNAQDTPPVAVLYFTDLENGSEQVQEPAYPVLWVTGRNVTNNPPFGQIVRIDVHV